MALVDQTKDDNDLVNRAEKVGVRSAPKAGSDRREKPRSGAPSRVLTGARGFAAFARGGVRAH
jgi:hypothetical protein